MAKEKSIFDIKTQHENVTGKIVVGLERISEAFRVLLWKHGKESGLSPIQIQILIFIKYHAEHLCGVSYLAKEFNLAKPTISDAVKSLEGKGLITKAQDSQDSRSHVISLTKEGKKITSSVEDFALPIKDKVDQLGESEQLQMLDSIIKVIYKLNQAEIITVQRTCFACKYYEKSPEGSYCHLMKSVLAESDIRVDCPEFESKAS